MKKIIIFLVVIIGVLATGIGYRYFSLQSQPSEKVYVAVEDEGKIVAFDPATKKIVSSIDLSAEHKGGRLAFYPHNVQVSPDSKTVWVTANAGKHEDHAFAPIPYAHAHGNEEEGEEPDEVVVIDLKIDRIIKRIPIAVGIHLAHVVLTPDNSFAYVTAQKEGAVYKIDAKTFAVAKRIPMPKESEPHGIRTAPDSSVAYIAMLKGKSLSILDLKTDIFSEIPLGGAAVQAGVTPDGKFAFISLYDTKQLAVYNTETKQVKFAQLPENAKGPVQMYSTPDSRYVYLADQGYYFGQPTSELVYKIDLEKIDWRSKIDVFQAVVKEIKAGSAPHGVVVSSDGKFVYVTNLLSNDVSVINTASDQEIARVPVGKGPNGISVWTSKQNKNSATSSLSDLYPETFISHGHGLAVDVKDSNKLYIATHYGLLALMNENDLYRIGKSKDDFMGFSPHPTDPNIFFTSGHPSSGGNLGFQKSEDGGVTWKKVSNGVNGPVDFHAMTVSPINPNLIYGWYQGNLQRSEDRGKTWEIINRDLQARYLAADSQDENTAYAATPRGVMVSKDTGITWASLSPELEEGAASIIVVHPKDAKIFLVFSEALGGFGKSADGGKTWKKVNELFGGEAVYHLAFDKNQSEIVYALTDKNSLYKSVDNGTMWNKIR